MNLIFTPNKKYCPSYFFLIHFHSFISFFSPLSSSSSATCKTFFVPAAQNPKSLNHRSLAGEPDPDRIWVCRAFSAGPTFLREKVWLGLIERVKMYKNQLQELAQRSCFNLPSYTCLREGPDHAPRFKATVNFNGETFETPHYCSTLRQAEHSAAEVALNSLSHRGPSHSLAAKILVSSLSLCRCCFHFLVCFFVMTLLPFAIFFYYLV